MAQFKTYLLSEREFAGSSVNRVMQTLRTFYKWMLISEYVSSDPTIGIEQKKLPKSKSKDLEAHEIEKIYAAIAQRSYQERDGQKHSSSAQSEKLDQRLGSLPPNSTSDRSERHDSLLSR